MMDEGKLADASGISSEDMKLISKSCSAIQDNQASRTTDGRRIQTYRSVPLEDKQSPALNRSSASLSDESLPDSSIDLKHEEPSSTPLRVQGSKVDDPFLYFSSDKNRMEFLLSRELSEMPLEEPIKRKTRISFELDPLHDMVNSFPDLFGTSSLNQDLDDSLSDLDIDGFVQLGLIE